MQETDRHGALWGRVGGEGAEGTHATVRVLLTSQMPAHLSAAVGWRPPHRLPPGPVSILRSLRSFRTPTLALHRREERSHENVIETPAGESAVRPGKGGGTWEGSGRGEALAVSVLLGTAGRSQSKGRAMTVRVRGRQRAGPGTGAASAWLRGRVTHSSRKEGHVSDTRSPVRGFCAAGLLGECVKKR